MSRAWLLRRVLSTGFCLLLIGAVTLTFLIVGGVSVGNALRGALVGSLAIIWLVAGVELTAPSAFLRWREWMMKGGPPPLQDLGSYFDRRLGSDCQGRRDETTMRRRIRVAGAVVLLVGTLTFAIVWWIMVFSHLI